MIGSDLGAQFGSYIRQPGREGHYFPGYKESGQCSPVPSAYAGFPAVQCSVPAIFLIVGYSEAMRRRCFPVALSNKT